MSHSIIRYHVEYLGLESYIDLIPTIVLHYSLHITYEIEDTS